MKNEKKDNLLFWAHVHKHTLECKLMLGSLDGRKFENSKLLLSFVRQPHWASGLVGKKVLSTDILEFG